MKGNGGGVLLLWLLAFLCHRGFSLFAAFSAIMARRSQSSSQGDNPLDPNYLPPHYKEYYRLALDKLAEEGEESYRQFLVEEGAPEFLCASEVEHISRHLQKPQYASQEGAGSTDSGPGGTDADGSSGTYWPMNSDLAVPELDLGWPMVFGFRGTEVTTLVQPPPPDNPSIKEEARRMIRAAQQVSFLAWRWPGRFGPWQWVRQPLLGRKAGQGAWKKMEGGKQRGGWLAGAQSKPEGQREKAVQARQNKQEPRGPQLGRAAAFPPVSHQRP